MVMQQIAEAHMIARQYNLLPPTMEQPQYHMFHRERVEVEYARVYREVGLGTTICRRWHPVYSPASTMTKCRTIHGSICRATNG